MEPLHLTLSCNEYDRTRFLVDGTVKAEGIDLNIVSLPSEERHRRFSRDLEFDVCELQMGVFLGWMGRGAPFTAIPVFPHRKFCHGNVLLNSASGIEKPEDLAGKIIGMRAHFNPVSLWMRGVLQEDYGVPARSLRIRTNQQEQVPGWQPPEWMDYERLPEGAKNRRRLTSRRSRRLHAAGNQPKAHAAPRSAPALAEFPRSRKTILSAHEDFSDPPRRRREKFDAGTPSLGGAKSRRGFYQSEGDGHQACERYAAILSCLVRR